ncbi:MAG: hypothetical protein ACE5GD_11330 [Candidatus Geothermarchaeales archaeon]
MPKNGDIWYCCRCQRKFKTKEDLDEHYRSNKDHLDAVFLPIGLKSRRKSKR